MRDKQIGYAVRVIKSHRISTVQVEVSHPELNPPSLPPCSGNSEFTHQGVHVASHEQSYFVKAPEPVHDFVTGETLGTEVNPKCGGCKCGKCPVRGHTFSFREEQELELINSNLKYDDKKQ